MLVLFFFLLIHHVAAQISGVDFTTHNISYGINSPNLTVVQKLDRLNLLMVNSSHGIQQGTFDVHENGSITFRQETAVEFYTAGRDEDDNYNSNFFNRIGTFGYFCRGRQGTPDVHQPHKHFVEVVEELITTPPTISPTLSPTLSSSTTTSTISTMTTSTMTTSTVTSTTTTTTISTMTTSTVTSTTRVPITYNVDWDRDTPDMTILKHDTIIFTMKVKNPDSKVGFIDNEHALGFHPAVPSYSNTGSIDINNTKTISFSQAEIYTVFCNQYAGVVEKPFHFHSMTLTVLDPFDITTSTTTTRAPTTSSDDSSDANDLGTGEIAAIATVGGVAVVGGSVWGISRIFNVNIRFPSFGSGYKIVEGVGYV